MQGTPSNTSKPYSATCSKAHLPSVLFPLALLITALGCGEAQPPNFVVILADDMGYGDLKSYNAASKIPTPNLNGFAASGMRFTDAHSPSAVCTPTRYGLLTGRYAWRTSLKSWVTDGYSPSLIDTSRMTLPKFLKEHGYVTGAFGKWHLGLGVADTVDYYTRLSPGPIDLGFDTFFGIPASLDFAPYVFIDQDRVAELPTEHVDASAMRRHGGGGFWRAGPIAPGFRHKDVLYVTTEKAVDFILSRDNAPFFLYVAFSAPHTPWLPTEEFEGVSDAGPYGDFVAEVDHAVGAILGALDSVGKGSSTFFAFTSDNGAHWLESDIDTWEHRANASLRGQKADIFEGGHRVPLIVRWPGIVDAGSTSDQLVSLTDFIATAADILGRDIAHNGGEDSFSFLPALHGIDIGGRESMIQHSGDGMFAVRRGNWKLILGRGSGGFTQPSRIETADGDPPGQLFNLAIDPGEENDLYAERSDIVRELSDLLSRIETNGHSQR